jgi:hypothetical protein
MKDRQIESERMEKYIPCKQNAKSNGTSYSYVRQSIFKNKNCRSGSIAQ